jgi:DNA-binding NtrC family response regulator
MRVVVVHDDPTFADPLAALLAGQDVALFTDPMAALDALDTVRTIEVLVTRVQFAPGQPNGIALARVARIKRPGIRVLFVAHPKFAGDAADLGTFMAHPVSVADVAQTVGRLLVEWRTPAAPAHRPVPPDRLRAVASCDRPHCWATAHGQASARGVPEHEAPQRSYEGAVRSA